MIVDDSEDFYLHLEQINEKKLTTEKAISYYQKISSDYKIL
jgi:hypothetical protein